jgi:hypothetical protein
MRYYCDSSPGFCDFIVKESLLAHFVPSVVEIYMTFGRTSITNPNMTLYSYNKTPCIWPPHAESIAIIKIILCVDDFLRYYFPIGKGLSGLLLMEDDPRVIQEKENRLTGNF